MSKAESGINIGIPVLWMVDPANPASALGVIYEFSVTKERVTVWYTEDGYPDPKARLITPEDLSHAAQS